MRSRNGCATLRRMGAIRSSVSMAIRGEFSRFVVTALIVIYKYSYIIGLSRDFFATEASALSRLLDDRQHDFLYLGCQLLDAGLREELDQGGREHRADICPALLDIDADRAGQHQGDFDVPVERLAGVLCVADLHDLDRIALEP